MIPLMRSTFLHEYETKEALVEFLRRATHLSMGAKCFEFEKAFAAYQGRKDAVLFNSGASANLALLQALKNLGRLKDGDRVGFSALTWSTNVMPLIQMNLVPVPVDCARETLNVMSSQLLARLQETDLKALFITNALGFTGDLDAIRAVCQERSILLIEDNCESLGTELPAGKAGNFGVGSTFSFFVAHHMSTVEGGMVCADDEELAEMLRIVRANGWDRNLPNARQHKWRSKHGVSSEFDAKYTFYDLAFNMRPTEITGFLGLFQLQYLPENVNTREANYLRLEKVAAQNEDLVKMQRGHIRKLSNFSVPVVCKTPELRSRYLAQFAGAGIEIRPLIAGNMQKQPFYKKYVSKTYALPETDFLHGCGFYFGNYPELTDTDLETIASCLGKY
ncbi:MAG TPA: DegT/DnrJ/EryC1/StrS aminotransferase family protein [Polyangiales bacterium]|nr:DegT/DnrJ/EryC1/StrS aminotransferase family protein [Polyangiales bacterium]